jgi:hypothetical protein
MFGTKTNPLLGEYGIKGDTAEGRKEFERQMEARRKKENDIVNQTHNGPVAPGNIQKRKHPPACLNAN